MSPAAGGWSRRAALAVAAGGTLGLVGCGGQRRLESKRRPRGAPPKHGEDRLRQDLEPLVARFPALGTPIRCFWMSGTLGSPWAPGPSTLWLDAVVQLTPETLGVLSEGVVPVADRPDIVAKVEHQLRGESMLSSPGLKAALSSEQWWADAWLVAGTDQLILSAIGSN